jgi:hypothetical protein
MNTKKGQMILFSIVMALFVFLLVLTLFFDSIITRPLIGGDKTTILEREATRLSDSILLAGYPENWHETTPQKIGLSTNNALNINKINNLSQIAQTNFETSKSLLGIMNDYFIKITYIDTGEQTIFINNTNLEEILNQPYVITRERTTLIQTNDRKTPAKIFIAVYTK